MSRLDDAVALARQQHTNQFDKSGKPYILHPLRVMSEMETESEKIVAVLHDVPEDTGMEVYDIHEEIGLTDDEIDALIAMTHLPYEPYPEYVKRVKVNPMAAKVKKADIMDNLLDGRMSLLTEEDITRLKGKYNTALEILEGKDD